jgi:hypothetical protein
MGPVLLVTLTAHNIPTLMLPNSALFISLGLSALTSRTVMKTEVNGFVKQVSNGLTSPPETTSQNKLQTCTAAMKIFTDVYLNGIETPGN